MVKVGFIANMAPHYRSRIYSLMDKEIGCDFIFGDRVEEIEKMDYASLSRFRKEIPNTAIPGSSFYFQRGAVGEAARYDTVLLTGDPRCISTWIILFFARISRRRAFLWSHGWYGDESRIKRIVKSIFFGSASGVFLYNRYARDLMVRNGFSPDRLFVIYNSLDYDRQVAIRHNLRRTDIYYRHFLNTDRNLVFTGRLTRTKQLEMLVRAVAELKRGGCPHNLTVVGDGGMRQELEFLARSLDVADSIWFAGETYAEETIAELFYNADLCVSPGNVGLAAIHAMTYGCPVVTHDCLPKQMPEFEAVRPGETGGFFSYGDLASLVKTILEWTSGGMDRDRIRANCYREVEERWNPHVQIKVLKEHLLGHNNT